MRTLHQRKKIGKDIFFHKKDIINNTIEHKKTKIKKWSELLHSLTNERADAENTISELKEVKTIKKLDRDTVNLLVDKILVHDHNDIEIIWNGAFSKE